MVLGQNESNGGGIDDIRGSRSLVGRGPPCLVCQFQFIASPGATSSSWMPIQII
jgi:hypothetical protein